MGLFGRKAAAADVDGLKREVSRLEARLNEAASTNSQLSERLNEAVTMNAQLSEGLSEATRSNVDIEARIEQLGNQVDQVQALPVPTQQFALADQAVIDELRLRLDRLEQHIQTVDERVTQTTTELANQITELSGELDGRLDSAPDAGSDAADSVATEAIDALRSGQERLANEQARYQIAFREDLAQLAERLRR